MSLLDRDRTALVVVDVQEGFRSYDSFAGVADACSKLVRAARILQLPSIVSEQYPKGLGHTAHEVGLDDGGEGEGSNEQEKVIEKSVFSAARADGFTLAGREQAIVCGIETHVCVSQTVHDLLDQGVQVHVPADAVGSRHPIDYERGLERLERAGAVVTTVEAALFELLQRAGTPEFKAVQKLILSEMTDPTAYVLLEDGTRYDGIACGADGHALGEIVFTTGMSGYQESMSDPSFAGQLIAFTYPHIGNYGVSAQAMESDRPWARAAIMREACDREDAPGAEAGWLQWLSDCGIPAISGVDTRALVIHIRDRGSMRGGVFPASMPEPQAREQIDSEPPMLGRDLAAQVSPSAISRHGETNAGPRIAVIDTGIKTSMVRGLLERGASVTLHPYTTTAKDLLAEDPDAVFLANGPGDPAALDYVVDTVRELVGVKPVWGICLGHQLLCRAVGLETFKLPFGHHGANHPVKDLQTGRIEITSQNHGFAALGPGGARTIEADEPVRWQTDYGEARLSHVNLYDRTVEGLELLDVPGGAVQYHPEAGPGPHDSLYLFDRFLARIAEEGRRSRPGRGWQEVVPANNRDDGPDARRG